MEAGVIIEKVKEALAIRLNIPKERVNPESYLTEDLGMDSFAAIEVIFELEEKFNISIPENDIAKVKKVQDIIDYINKRVTSAP